MSDVHRKGSSPHKLVVITVSVTLLIISLYLLGTLFLKVQPVARAGAVTAGIGPTLWHERSVDLVTQGLILFAGALGVLALFGGKPARPGHRSPREEARS